MMWFVNLRDTAEQEVQASRTPAQQEDAARCLRCLRARLLSAWSFCTGLPGSPTGDKRADVCIYLCAWAWTHRGAQHP